MESHPEIRIVEYDPKYATAFRTLNEEWITRYFILEDADRKALEHPHEYILDKGGHIFIALYKNEPVGTCALIKTADDEYELAKMAVSPRAQGKGIGYLLGKVTIARANELKAKSLFLESNTKLTPALSLYRKLGFTEVPNRPSPYERCNIRMEIRFPLKK